MSTAIQVTGEISSYTKTTMRGVNVSQETHHLLQIFPSEVNKSLLQNK